ncbi:MAG: hypothetical protein ACXWIT_16435 [Burkholderiales bacterium]
MPKIWSGVLALMALLVGACASTPEAPSDRDAEAKQFLTHPNASTIYVYRIDVEPSDDHVVLYIDSRLIGETLPRTYFRIDAVPGRHVLHGTAVDSGRLELETRAGALYFVELSVAAGQSNFGLVPEEIGRKRILECCTLLENWAPGQRPFLK